MRTLYIRHVPDEVAAGLEKLAAQWELRTNLSAYDALYVALAERLDAPLLTADARLARAPGPRCPVEVLEP
jgi:predicted nucleic acid-binding protein